MKNSECKARPEIISIIGTNETRQIKWHKKCKYICRLSKLFVIINKNGINLNVDVNVKN